MTESALTALIHHLRSLAEKSSEATLSDRQLLDRYLTQRDEAAFTALVRRHGPLVLSACRRVLSEESDVEDAFQATFLVLLRKASSVRWQTSMGGWLFGVAHRLALKARASALRRRHHEMEANRRRPRPEDKSADLSWREAMGLLHEELNRLPDKYRLPLLLCYLDGKTREEAAQALGCSATSIKGRLERGREMLRMRLTRRGVSLSGALLAALVDAPAASSVAPALIRATREAARTGIYRTSVAALMKGAMPAVWMGKARLAAVTLLTVCLLAVGGGSPRTSPESPAAKPSECRQPPPAPAQEKTKEGVIVRGRVLGPDGKPIQGARLYSARLHWAFPHDDAIVALAQAKTTGAEGRFRVHVKKPKRDEYDYLIAQAPGLGVDWINLNEGNLSSEVTLRLVKDVPITGRIVSTEGRPVAGVSVSIAQVVSPNGTLDDYLKKWDGGSSKALATLSTPRKRLYAPLDAIGGAVTTDKDGRFTLRGAGGERIVHVTVSGGGVAHSTPYVVTRPGFDAKPYNAVLRGDEDGRIFLEWNRFFGLYPPDFTFVAEAGRTIEGTVKDMDTGKPLAGCRVITGTSYSHGIAALSNAEGKYRLEGLAKRSGGYKVWVRPPKQSTYLYDGADKTADRPGLTTIRQDFQLAKGVIVSGRVVDKRTGKGVPCYFRSLPLPDNKFLGTKPRFVLGSMDTSREIETSDDGRFRLVTIPGKALLAVGVDDEKRFHGDPLCIYRRAAPDPDHKDVFRKSGDTWRVITAPGNRLELLSQYNAVKVIDVKEDGETRVELSVDRGATARIAVQDAGGKPLTGVWAAGLTDHWPVTYQLPEATATVYALNPAKPRTMAFFHAEKKLGGTVTVRGDEKEPVVVKLSPVGKISGRLLDLEGNPLKGVEVSINAETDIGSELYRFAAPTGKPVRTGKDGRFHIEGVVPDLKFRLNLRKEGNFFTGEPRIGIKQIKPGEALDLGNVRVKQLR